MKSGGGGSSVVPAERVCVEWSTWADCGALYWAFTEGLGDWLADASSMSVVAEPGAAFCFRSAGEPIRTHYGRIVELVPNHRIALKWISESTGGVETDVVIDIAPTATGSSIRLEQLGIGSPAHRRSVTAMWESAIESLDAFVLSPAFRHER